jgi:hypothetical protein
MIRRLVRSSVSSTRRDQIYRVRERTARRARHAVARRLSRVRKGNLDLLAWAYETDKGSWDHDYARIYQRHLGPSRKRVTSVLEIGVGGETSWTGYETTAGGQSLRMWADFFPNARVVGIDLHPKDVSGPRIVVEQGDQADPAFLERVVRDHGPFDLVVDDGSHIGRHVIASYGALWGAVKPGGTYIIEDLPAAYSETWEGGPPGTPGTAVALLKDLLDQTVARYGEDFLPSISAMHVYAGTALLQKQRAR